MSGNNPPFSPSSGAAGIVHPINIPEPCRSGMCCFQPILWYLGGSVRPHGEQGVDRRGAAGYDNRTPLQKVRMLENPAPNRGRTEAHE